MIKLALLALSLALLCSQVAAKEYVTVEWNGIRIRTQDRPTTIVRSTRQYSKFPIVDCAFRRMKTKCWKLRQARIESNGERELYGHNLKFVRPIAILPSFSLEENEGQGFDYEKAYDSTYLSSLRQFEFRKFSAKNLDGILDDGAITGGETEDFTFSVLNQTIGGDYALDIWRSLVGKLPKRECAGTDGCAVVTKAVKNGGEAIARCSVQNSALGIGIPYNCETVAFANKGTWLLYSYGGPAQCGECGAGGGARCTFESKLALKDIAALLVDALQKGRTNITLKSFEETKDSIQLLGQNIGTPSKFFAGYYDRSYAAYTVSRFEDDITTISGLFNLLISVEQSDKGVDYRDFGNGKARSDLEWFQNQVLGVIKSTLSQKLNTELRCKVMPLL